MSKEPDSLRTKSNKVFNNLKPFNSWTKHQNFYELINFIDFIDWLKREGKQGKQ